jgi:hypothetical protein
LIIVSFSITNIKWYVANFLDYPRHEKVNQKEKKNVVQDDLLHIMISLFRQRNVLCKPIAGVLFVILFLYFMFFFISNSINIFIGFSIVILTFVVVTREIFPNSRMNYSKFTSITTNSFDNNEMVKRYK